MYKYCNQLARRLLSLGVAAQNTLLTARKRLLRAVAVPDAEQPMLHCSCAMKGCSCRCRRPYVLPALSLWGAVALWPMPTCVWREVRSVFFVVVLVWGGFRGIQHGSNEAAPHDAEGPAHAMQRIRHLNNYWPVLLHGIVACVANANASFERPASPRLTP